MIGKRTIIVYGNCQAEAISVIFGLNQSIAEKYAVHYVPSYQNVRFDGKTLSHDDVEICDLLCEQHDPILFPQREALPQSCVTVRFPSVDFNALWPFNATNPYNPVESMFPFGRFPYSDRIVLSQIEKGKSAVEVLEYYLTRWDEYKIDLDRLLKIEKARVFARDAKCDVAMGEHLFNEFANERPLWTINHPSRPVLKELVKRIIVAASERMPDFSGVNIGETVDKNFVLSPRGPLGVVSVPIHPMVAEHFGLTWYDPDERFYLFDGTDYSYEAYFQELIERTIIARNKSLSDVHM